MFYASLRRSEVAMVYGDKTMRACMTGFDDKFLDSRNKIRAPTQRG